jgi:hypothetical protein
MLLFHGNNGFANAPRRYVTRTFPLLFYESKDNDIVNRGCEWHLAFCSFRLTSLKDECFTASNEMAK